MTVVSLGNVINLREQQNQDCNSSTIQCTIETMKQKRNKNANKNGYTQTNLIKKALIFPPQKIKQ